MKLLVNIVQHKDRFDWYPYQTEKNLKFEDYLYFDFDNYSEKGLLKYGLDLVKDCNQAIIKIHLHKEGKVGVIPYFFRKSLPYKHKITIITEGENDLLSRLFVPFNK